MAARRGRNGGGAGAPPADPARATTAAEAPTPTPDGDGGGGPAAEAAATTVPEATVPEEPHVDVVDGDRPTVRERPPADGVRPAGRSPWPWLFAGALVAIVVLAVLLATRGGEAQQVAAAPTPTAVVKAVVAPTATATAVPTATAQPTATQVATAVATAAVQAAPADAQVSPDGVYYLRIANPGARFEEANQYWLVQAHNGVSKTNLFILDVPQGYVGVVQALAIDGQGGGWVKAYGPGVHTVRATSVFAGITLDKWASSLFQERVDLATSLNWARQHIEPLAQWKAAS